MEEKIVRYVPCPGLHPDGRVDYSDGWPPMGEENAGRCEIEPYADCVCCGRCEQDD